MQRGSAMCQQQQQQQQQQQRGISYYNSRYINFPTLWDDIPPKTADYKNGIFMM
jgi:hypothetical protein